MIIFFVILGYGLFFGVAVALFFQWGTLWPKPIELVPVYTREGDAPSIPSDRALRVMTWNVQFFAGREPVFFYDVPNENAPRAFAQRESIARNLQEVARVIQSVDPDVIFLQEVDDGATRTYRENQSARLLELLPAQWRWYAEAFYWKAAFVPHSKILGSSGMKLVTISKLALERIAYRRALPEMPDSWLVSRFQLKRAMLETRVSEGPWKGLVLLNTHLDAFAQGSDTMDRQVEVVKARLDELSAEGRPWVVGGDFNLIVPGAAEAIAPTHRGSYRPDRTELAPLLEKFSVYPAPEQARKEEFFTHWPKDPDVMAPDRTIDYFFFSKDLKLQSGKVVQKEVWDVSDHFPVVGEWR
jgi:endonuclease/exonuclease/phosphatase family metal-dependent hydrolase